MGKTTTSPAKRITLAGPTLINPGDLRFPAQGGIVVTPALHQALVDRGTPLADVADAPDGGPAPIDVAEPAPGPKPAPYEIGYEAQAGGDAPAA